MFKVSRQYMTVGELLKLLAQYPSEANVVVAGGVPDKISYCAAGDVVSIESEGFTEFSELEEL